jgi:asparagine synthase (glutamine-hydrolysing)
MINIKLTYNKGYKWVSNNNIFVKGYIFTPENELLKNEALIKYFSDACSFKDFQTKLQNANGLFTVVIKKENSLWAAIDHSRTFPLFYYHKKDSFWLVDNPDLLKSDNIYMELDEDNAVLLSYSGFVPGEKTLLKDVFQFRAGECLCYENDMVSKEFHTKFLTNTFFTNGREQLKKQLKDIIDKVGKRMIKALDNRPVAIPLSGGYDSRLIAYMLRKNNYPNVFCFTYGLFNNIESKNAQRTAKNLGYEWYFIDYADYFDKPLNQYSDFKEYVDFSGTCTNKFYTQEYYAAKNILETQKVPQNTIFISGHSGAIAGHLLTKQMLNDKFSFVDYVLDSIFGFVYPRKKDIKIIRNEIEFLNNHEKKYPTYLLYENWRFRETTVKLGINASRIWDFFGYEHLIPLWDKEFYQFFVQVPLAHKCDKNLYVETLTELFKELNIFFPEEELLVSEKVIKKVSFRSKLKKCFPFLKRFINIWKNDNIGSKYYSRCFTEELEKSKNYRKMLSVNGIYSAWYVNEVRKKLKNK